MPSDDFFCGRQKYVVFFEQGLTRLIPFLFSFLIHSKSTAIRPNYQNGRILVLTFSHYNSQLIQNTYNNS